MYVLGALTIHVAIFKKHSENIHSTFKHKGTMDFNMPVFFSAIKSEFLCVQR